MRSLGLLLSLLGIIAIVTGTLVGFRSMADWNGRRQTGSFTLPDGAPFTQAIPSEPGRRYTMAIEVVYDRDGTEAKGGRIAVESKMPLVARLEDASGAELATAVGWLDPNEPPTVLRGEGQLRGELVAERILGPVVATRPEPMTARVELGDDRLGAARVLERRIIVYDDALPASIGRVFAIVGGGAVALFVGLAALLREGFVRFFRKRAKRQGGIRARQPV